jgi:hypothetical protein
MKEVIFIFWGISLVLFSGMIHFFLASKRPGVYPPRNILKKRSVTLALGGTLFLCMGIVLRFFQ